MVILTTEQEKKINKVIRGYDVRGIFNIDLTTDIIEKIGEAFGDHWNGQKILIGMDNRNHSQNVFNALVKGLQLFDIKIYNCGLTTTPALTFASKTLSMPSMMITASHNNVIFNGLKINKPNIQAYSGNEIKKIVLDYKNIIPQNNIKHPIEQFDANEIYVNYLLQKFTIKMKNKKITWNCMNASVNKYINDILPHLKSNNVILNDDISNLKENPDPTIKQNINETIEFVLKNQCEIGFIFDGDCDRIVIIDDLGRKVLSEHVIMILAKYLNFNNETIVCDIQSSHKLHKFLKDINCKFITSEVGHAIMKKKILENNAILSGEISGHYIFRDFGCDDGLYVALTILNILQNLNYKLSEIIDELPKIFCSENIRIYMSENEANHKIKKIFEYTQKNSLNIDETDGIKITDKMGWILIRKSKTEDCLSIRFEAFDENDYNAMEKYKDLLLNL